MLFNVTVNWTGWPGPGTGMSTDIRSSRSGAPNRTRGNSNSAAAAKTVRTLASRFMFVLLVAVDESVGAVVRYLTRYGGADDFLDYLKG